MVCKWYEMDALAWTTILSDKKIQIKPSFFQKPKFE